MDENLQITRIQKIRDAVNHMYIKNYKDQINICYLAPWYEVQTDIKIDLIFSQAVFEHIDNLEFAVDKMVELLEIQGVMSHVIDYTAHETHKVWNGHWTYPDYLWRIICKGRSYPLNRKPHSYYLGLFERKGLKIVFMQPTKQFGGMTYKDIPIQNRHLFKESDFEISGCYFILKKHII
jgi:trans-aconitate methyltransferase